MQARLQLLTVCILLAGPAKGAAECEVGRVTSPDRAAEVIKDLENRWIKAYAERDVELLKCILTDDFQVGSMPDRSLETHDRQHVLDWITHRNSPVQNQIEDLKVQVSGNVAVARGIYLTRDSAGKPLARYQFTDLFAQRTSHWRGLAREVSELPVSR
jgi:ketosteroid isomerase-like protein